MKFVIENMTKSSGRLGTLLHSDTNTKFHTPLLLQCTKVGSIPHLSPEVFDYISTDNQILLLSLSTISHMKESLKAFGKGVSAFVGYKRFPNIMTVRDVCEGTPSGYNDKNTVPLFTRRGKETLSPEQFMEIVEAIQPDAYVGLSDTDTNEESSKKRVQKSVERTDEFFNYCYKKHKHSASLAKKSLLVPIVGGYNKFARSLSIRNVKDKANVTGYSLEGFHNNGLTATKLNREPLIDVVSHCVEELDSEKVKLMLGAYDPVTVTELIRLGVDIFDTSYAYVSAVNFKALVFSFNLSQEVQGAPYLDITDEGFKEDFTPFLKDCKCIACEQHTKAYVHHLYNTKELLGPMLLMIHNIHHYMEFFTAIRAAIARDSMENLIQLLKFQRSSEIVDYSIKELPKLISKGEDKRAMFNSMAAT